MIIALDFGVCHTALAIKRGRAPAELHKIEVAGNHKVKGGERTMNARIWEVLAPATKGEGVVLTMETMEGFINPETSKATLMTIRLETLITEEAVRRGWGVDKVSSSVIKGLSSRFNAVYLKHYKPQMGSKVMSSHEKDALSLLLYFLIRNLKVVKK